RSNEFRRREAGWRVQPSPATDWRSVTAGITQSRSRLRRRSSSLSASLNSALKPPSYALIRNRITPPPTSKAQRRDPWFYVTVWQCWLQARLSAYGEPTPPRTPLPGHNLLLCMVLNAAQLQLAFGRGGYVKAAQKRQLSIDNPVLH